VWNTRLLSVSERLDKTYNRIHPDNAEQQYKYKSSFGLLQTSMVSPQGFKDLYNEINNIFEVTYIDCCD